MARSRLIGTTDLSALSPVLVDGVAIQARYEKLRDFIEERAPGLASLFAEPVLGAATPTGYKSAAWYGASVEEPSSIQELTGIDRDVAVSKLRAALASLTGLANEAPFDGWLRAAIIVPNADSIRVADGNVTLINWGFVPANLPQTAEALERQFVSIVGTMVGLEGYPPGRPSSDTAATHLMRSHANDEPVVPAAADTTGADSAGIPAAGPGAIEAVHATEEMYRTQDTRQPEDGKNAASPPLWMSQRTAIAAGILLFIAGLTIGLLWVGFGSSGPSSSILPTDQAKVGEALRQGLVDERDRLQAMLRGDVCVLSADQLPSRLLNKPPKPDRSEIPTPPRNMAQSPQEPKCQVDEKPTQVMVVMDTSGSMNLPAGNRPDLVEMERLANMGNVDAGRKFEALTRQPGRKRMDDARGAALELIDVLSSKAAVGVASFFQSCGARVDLAPTTDRAEATRILEGLRGAGATPLAASLRLMRDAFGPNGDDGATRTVIVITDGRETCKGDPCAEARELAQIYKNLKIHVIDVTGTSQMQCVAEITKGTISQAGDLEELKAAVARAASDVRRQMSCQPTDTGRPGELPGKADPTDTAQPASPVGTPKPADPQQAAPSPAAKDPDRSSLTLNDQLERASALIIAPQLGSTGSGFFISPDMLVTSRHVVQAKGRTARDVIVTSKALKRPYKGEVVATSDESAIGGRDYAVIRLNEVPYPTPVILPITGSVEKRSTVIAAGYPGYLTQGDPAMQRLSAGDLSAAPDLVLSEGKVQVMHESTSGVPIVVHSADISQGNSGGPLVDACGRIVAINTFIGVDPQSGRRGLFSLGGSDLLAFLRMKGITARTVSSACDPG